MPRNYVRMTERELLEKLEDVKKEADIVYREWLDGEYPSNEASYRLWVDLRREYGALKGNFRRWHRR